MRVKSERPAFSSVQLEKEYERDNAARGIASSGFERVAKFVARKVYRFEPTVAERQQALVDRALARFDANGDAVIDASEKQAFDQARARYERQQQADWERAFGQSKGWAAFAGALSYVTDALTSGYERAMLERGAHYEGFEAFLSGTPRPGAD